VGEGFRPLYVGTGLVPVRSTDNHKGCSHPADNQGQETFPTRGYFFLDKDDFSIYYPWIMKPFGVNIVATGPGWMKILSQEGIPIYRESDVWIVQKKTEGVLDFVENGGMVLCSRFTAHGSRFTVHDSRPEGGLGYTEEKIGEGNLITLSFDPDALFLDRRRKRRCFYSKYGRFPDEAVSSIPHARVRRIVLECIRRLFSKKRIPYIHNWYYPEGRTLFAIRIDTEYSSPERVIALERALSLMGIRATFFLNIRTLKKDLLRVLSFNHAYGIHCYNHRVYPDREKNYKNIKKAKEIFEQSGKKVKGFASPYGIWNEGLGSALRDLGFSYSSEFSLAYDDLPFFPAEGEPLQIPVHPICLERLFMSRHTKDEAKSYFLSLINNNLLSGEPIIIYSHPDAILKNLDILGDIIDYVKEQDIWITDMDEIDSWWREREGGRGDGGTGGQGAGVQGIREEIILPDGRWALHKPDGEIDIKKLSFNPARIYTYKEVRGNPIWLFLRGVEAMFYQKYPL